MLYRRYVSDIYNSSTLANHNINIAFINSVIHVQLERKVFNYYSFNMLHLINKT